MRKILLLALGGLIALPIFLVNFLFLREVTTTFYLLNFIAALTIGLPLIISIYIEHMKLKKLEENFTTFLRDFTEAVRAGMTIPFALKHVSRNDYGPLSKYVRKMSAQLDWGIPLHTVLSKFSEECESRLIGRTISSVVESHAYGGSLTDVMEALSATVVEVEKLRAERRLFIQSQMMTGYIIFFVFLGVIIGLEKFLIPSLAQVGGAAPLPGIEAVSPEIMTTEYKIIFRNLVILQGIFAGLIIGKMAEGEVIVGIKHSVFLVLIGSLVFLVVG
ncbi:MAG: type II secretion system F family protein [Candidatus Aenigmarchaeota archaeon]|nr:type II secretion system F family protein [Candidatus Aenigmarchaeota archaeon]